MYFIEPLQSQGAINGLSTSFISSKQNLQVAFSVEFRRNCELIYSFAQIEATYSKLIFLLLSVDFGFLREELLISITFNETQPNLIMSLSFNSYVPFSKDLIIIHGP